MRKTEDYSKKIQEKEREWEECHLNNYRKNFNNDGLSRIVNYTDTLIMMTIGRVVGTSTL